MAGDMGEDLEDPMGARCRARSKFGIERNAGPLGRLHASADLAFDQGLNDECEPE
jgi:hypothetical protein